MGFVSIDTWTIIFQWCNLFILCFIVKKLLFKPVKKMLDQRDKEIKDMYSKAEESQKMADLMRNEYKQRLDSAKGEAEVIVKNAVKKAKLQSESIVSDAHKRADKISEKAKANIEAERRNAVNEIKNDISSMAVSIAEKVLEKEVSEEEHDRMIEQIIERME